MKHLVIARHGNYGFDHRLNDYGREQMAYLGRALKDALNGSSVYIVSSPAPRAFESAEILKGNWGAHMISKK